MALTSYKIKNKLFIYLNSNTNPASVTFNESIQWKQLILNTVTIKGVPVTSGVPDSIVYYLTFENSTNHAFHVCSNDQAFQGIPIPITGNYSHEHFDNPGYIVDNQQSPPLKTVTIRLRDKDGNDAVFSEVALWFTYFN